MLPFTPQLPIVSMSFKQFFRYICPSVLLFASGNLMAVSPSPYKLVDQTLRLAENDYDLKKRHDFRHIKVIRDFEEKLPEIQVTVTEIEQVLLNLLKNSAQAMASTFEPEIKIRAHQSSENEVTIELEDNGPGIPENIRTRIFEPFFTTKEVGTGTGLGLSVSYMIITKNHKGTITAENSPKKGAKFVIKLPIRKEE